MFTMVCMWTIVMVFLFQMKKFGMYFLNQLRTVRCCDRMLSLQNLALVCIMELSACFIPIRHFQYHSGTVIASENVNIIVVFHLFHLILN